MNITLAPRWASSSLSLSGSSYLDCGTPPILSALTSFTLEAWIKPSELSGFQTIVGNVDNALGGQYQIYLSDNYLVAFVGIAPHVIMSNIPINVNEWHHVASTFDATSSTLTLYLDGNQVAKGIFKGVLLKTSTNILIGAGLEQNKPISFFSGEMGRVMIWNSVRSPEDILNDSVQVNIYKATENPNLIFYTDFSVLPIVDSSGNNIPLSFKNNPEVFFNVPSVVTGQSGYIDCGSYPDYSLPGNKPYTIEGWFFPTNQTNGCIISYGKGSEWEYRIQYSNNRIIAERNSDISKIATSNFIIPNSYYHFAVTYDSTVKTLSIYINGNLQVVDYFASEVAPVINGNILIGAQYSSQGNPTNMLNGAIQNIRLWNACLQQSEVFQWMYNDVINDNRLVSNFDFTVDPPVDNTDNAKLELIGGAVQQILQLKAPFTEPATQIGLPQSYNAIYLNQEAEAPVPPPNNVLFADQPEIFSEQCHFESWKDFAQQAGFENVNNEEFRERFDTAFNKAKKMMEDNPLLQKVFSRTDLDGITKIVYHGPKGDMLVYEGAKGAVDECTLWWITFIYQLTVGFYQALGILPKTGDIATRIYNLVSGNAAVMSAITSLAGKVITVTSAVGVMGVIYQQGLIWPIIKFVFTSGGWYLLFWILKKAIAIATGLEAAELLAGFVVWALQLTNTSTNYNSQCGQKLLTVPA